MARGGERSVDGPRTSTLPHKAAVVLVVVLAVGSVSLLVRHLTTPSSGRMCTLAGTQAPEGDTPEEAFALWWRTVDHEGLRHIHRDEQGRLPARPAAEGFVRDGRNYRWYLADDVWLQVDIEHPREAGRDTSDGWTVVGANRCRSVSFDEL